MRQPLCIAAADTTQLCTVFFTSEGSSRCPSEAFCRINEGPAKNPGSKDDPAVATRGRCGYVYGGAVPNAATREQK